MRFRALIVTTLVLSSLVVNGVPATHASSDAAVPSRATVGAAGNEPIIRVAPDGTVYVSALQHLYRSTDHATTWTEISPSPYAAEANLASDSSIDISPDGAEIAMTFDWPYAGLTAVCLSHDRGDSWLCDGVAVPTPSDRMWVHYLPDGRLFLLTGIALDVATGFVQPVAGVPVFVPGTPQPVGVIGGQLGDVAQGWGPTAHDGVLIMPSTFGPTTLVKFNADGGFAGSQAAGSMSTSISSLARDASGALFGTSEAGGLHLVRYRGAFGVMQASFVAVPTGVGDATFSAIAAGPTGHVTIVYYGSSDGKATWLPYAATTNDASAASPTWTIQALASSSVHEGVICAALSCDGAGRFAGDLLSATFDASGTPWWTWIEQAPGNGATKIVVGSAGTIVPPPPPSPAPMLQSGAYGLPAGEFGSPCDSMIKNCVHFRVPEGATTMRVDVRDAFAPHVGADACLNDCNTQRQFCDGATIDVTGVSVVDVFVNPDGVGPSYCTTNAPGVGTSGTITAQFS